MSVVSWARIGDIAVVTLNNPPVNAASHALRQGLWAAIDETKADDAARAVVLIGAGRGFVAGADITEFNAPPRAPLLPDLIAHLEAAPKPWVAALHGQALGGGLELALGCHYRIATPNCQFGLPEVTLGLIPGAGGTVRLPRLIAAKAAVEMITSGKPITAQHALANGLIDAVASADLHSDALAFAQSIAAKPLPHRLLDRAPQEMPPNAVWAELRATLVRRTKGQLAPLAAFDMVHIACTQPAADALIAERAQFMALKVSDQSRALRQVFAAERAAAKPALLKGITPQDITATAVIGGGTMGSGIATALLLAGYPVHLVEQSNEALKAGMERIATNLAASLKRGLISQTQLTTMQAALTGAPDYTGLGAVDLVIEAVFEDFAVKQQVLAKLEEVCAPYCILASNTSYLNLNALADGLAQPARLIGLHFFSPAHIMKLLEIVTTTCTAPLILAAGFALAKRLRKVAVLSGVCDGFIGNRIMSAYRRECDYMLADGASPVEIDTAMRDFGFPMGIYEMQDMAGLDIAWAMRKRRAATRDATERYIPIADQLCELGRFGRKTGAGWYAYPDGKTPTPDPVVAQIITDYRRAAAITPQAFTGTTIMARILAVMQAEARALLAEGIAQNANDIDVVMINGYGFPRWRGGPMFMQGASTLT